MHDDKTASDYNLEGGSTLHLVSSAQLSFAVVFSTSSCLLESHLNSYQPACIRFLYETFNLSFTLMIHRLTHYIILLILLQVLALRGGI